MPLGASNTVPVVAIHAITWLTREALNSGRAARSCATAPATCGHAIEVPEMVEVSESLPLHAAVTLEPGANMSTQDPKLLKLLMESPALVEPTVMASGADPGE